MRNKSRKRKQMMISAAIVVCVAAIVAGYFIKNRNIKCHSRIFWTSFTKINVYKRSSFGRNGL